MISLCTQRARLGLTGLVLVSLGFSACSNGEDPASALGSESSSVATAVVSARALEPATSQPEPATLPEVPPTATQPPETTTTAQPETTTTAPPETTTTTPPETTTTAPPETTTTTPPETTIAPDVVGAFATPLAAVGASSGAQTQVLQMRLLQLGFWLSTADGRYDITTRQAVMAFQKYLGIPATGSVDGDTAAYLTNVDTRARGQSNAGTLVEIDKGRQLLFFIVDGRTQWAYNTSTATGLPYEIADKNTPGKIIKDISITPNGLWRVERERPEGWWEGDLGRIYRPKYFRGGVAVHGSNSVPNYPASHGCVRLSVEAMDFVWANDMMPMGSTVWVHE